MRVVIIGAGKVGDALSFQLAKEGCDVIVVDRNLKNLEKISNSYDVITIEGNATSREVLLEADVQTADMVIAVTSSDEVNALSCIMSKHLGAKYTISRMRSPDFAEQAKFFTDELGIDMMLNPEQEAARFISRTLKYPIAFQVETFANGRINLVEIELKEKYQIAGEKLSDLNQKLGTNILVACVVREDEVFIPTGDFEFELGDYIYITASTKDLQNFFRTIGVIDKKIKNVMLIGGGSISYYVAKQLEDLRMNVRVIENNPQKAQLLSRLIPQTTVILGDGTDPELLDEERLGMMDACISLTGIDEENIIISLYAHSKKVDKIITKVNRRGFVKMGANVEGTGTIVTPKDIMVTKIVQYVRAKLNSKGSNVQTLVRLANDNVEALEFKVADDFHYTNIPLTEITLKPNILFAYISRGNTTIFPRGNDVILPGDHIMVVTTRKRLNDLNDIFEESWIESLLNNEIAGALNPSK